MPSLLQSISDRNKIYGGGMLKDTICQKDRRHQYQDLIVISLKLHHKQQQTRTRSKRPLKIVGRLLGTGSIAAADPIRHCKERWRNDAREDVFVLTKKERTAEGELIDGVMAADTK
jgi:hypothetical protein